MGGRLLCKFWEQGRCNKGTSCQFSHGGEADATTQGPAGGNVCRFYLRGNCQFGDSCRYDHIRPDGGAARPRPGVGPETGGPLAASDPSALLADPAVAAALPHLMILPEIRARFSAPFPEGSVQAGPGQ